MSEGGSEGMSERGREGKVEQRMGGRKEKEKARCAGFLRVLPYTLPSFLLTVNLCTYTCRGNGHSLM